MSELEQEGRIVVDTSEFVKSINSIKAFLAKEDCELSALWVCPEFHRQVSESFLNGDQALAQTTKRRMHRKGFFVMTLCDVDIRADSRLDMVNVLYEITPIRSKPSGHNPILPDGGPAAAHPAAEKKAA